MKLNAKARAFIAETLLEFLDLDEDLAVSPEWLKEIRRRCDEIDSSGMQLLDGDSVMAELRKKYA